MNHTSKVRQEITQRINEMCEKVTEQGVQIIDLIVKGDWWQAEHGKAMANLKKAETQLAETRAERDKWKEDCEQATVRMAEALHAQHQLRSFAPNPFRKQPAQPVIPILSKAEIHANAALNSLLCREDLISANRLLAGHKDDIDLIIERAKDIGARMAATT